MAGETDLENMEPMDLIGGVADGAGVSGDELREYVEANKTVTLTIADVGLVTDRNGRKCVMLRMVGDVFGGRKVSQKYTATQARELKDAFARIKSEPKLMKTYEWDLGIKPAQTQFPRLRPIKAVKL